MDEQDEIARYQRSIEAANRILEEVSRQDTTHEDGYPATRNGIRLGLATAADELQEALEAWQVYKLTSNWLPVSVELVHCAAVIVRIVREIGI